MNRLTARLGMVLALALTAAGAGGAMAGGDRGESDHDEAFHAVEQGRARPLADILKGLEGELGGKVVGVEFEAEGGRYIYEFKVITPSGDLREVYVDATTARILDHGE